MALKVTAKLTIPISLEGVDNTVDSGALQVALEEALEGATIYVGPKRSAFTVTGVDDPVFSHVSIRDFT